MLSVGDKFPDFQLKSVVSNDLRHAFKEIALNDFKGKWLIIFFWPKDFTFVCPTEIAAFGELHSEFLDREAHVLGASVDSEFVHLALRKEKEELRELPFPMVSDVKRSLSEALGILNREEGVSNRATFVVDPQVIIRFTMVTDLNVGRNPQEVLRVLDALQTDELCPCNWHPGEETIHPEKE